jgi:cytochrome b involved in lipid metabolism
MNSRNTKQGSSRFEIFINKRQFRDDCWIAFAGKAYNCSPYMDFHPGGGDELMKSAGEDGTELFQKVHRWVNLERILGPCLIGPYRPNAPPSNNFLKP